MTAGPSGRRLPIVLALVGLLVVLGIALATAVPWDPLPGAELRPDAARDFTPAEAAREVAFHDAVRPPAYASLLLGLGFAGLLGLTPLGARLVSRVSPARGWALQVLLGSAALVTAGRLVTLPVDALAERALRRYGLSTQTWGSWLVDAAKGVGVTVGLTSLVLLVVLALARAAPRTWWAWASAAAAALVVAGSFAYPVVVEPVFHRFESLPAGQLRTDLLDLAARDGVPVRDVLLADASRRTTALNAYVSGFGATRRIVLYDTLVERATPAEVELVVAHELGHAKRRDVLAGTLLGALAAAAGVCLLALLLSTRLLLWSGASSPGDPRVLALLLFLTAAGTLVLAPATNLVSRRIEARADVHSLDLTQDVATFIATEQRLARTNLADLEPHPVLHAIFATHPATTERISLAREWERLRR